MSNFQYRKKSWRLLKDKKVYETPIFDLHQQKTTPGEDKDAGMFYVLKAPEWINVIPLTKDNEIILVEQYRHGIDEITLEIPGGMVDPGEEPMQSAARELSEETGFTAKKWTSLGRVSSNPAILNNFTHLYLAEQCEPTEKQNTGTFEDIAIHILPLDRFLDLVLDGTVHHSIVLSAVARYLLYREARRN